MMDEYRLIEADKVWPVYHRLMGLFKRDDITSVPRPALEQTVMDVCTMLEEMLEGKGDSTCCESVKKVVKEGLLTNIYKGIDLHSLDPQKFGPKVDAAFKQGWSKERIQSAIDELLGYKNYGI